MNRYLNSLDEISSVLKDRRNRRTAIRSGLDKSIQNRYGILDFSRKLRTSVLSQFGIDPDEADEKNQSFGILARQIPGVSAEDIACHCLSRRAKLTPLSLAFTRDAFVSGSNDKARRARIPFVSWSKKGHLQLNNEVVVETPNDSLGSLDMVRMDRIKTTDEFGGISLPEFHRTMHTNLFNHFEEPGRWGDISSFYGQLLAESIENGKSPDMVWRTGLDLKDKNWNGTVSAEEARDLTIRPSSKWYYGFYLSMFLDGTFVLLDTYDNDSGGVPLAKALFEKEADCVKSQTGFSPLVIKTFPLRKDMLFVNRAMVDDPERAAAFMESQKYWEADTVEMTRWLANQAIQFA